jgi:hypothetical protein
MSRRIFGKLVLALVLMGTLLLLWSGNIDFVYTGF